MERSLSQVSLGVPLLGTDDCTQYLAKILGGESVFFRVRTWVADTYIPKRPRTKKIFGFGCTLAHSLIVGEYLEKKNSIDES